TCCNSRTMRSCDSWVSSCSARQAMRTRERPNRASEKMAANTRDSRRRRGRSAAGSSGLVGPSARSDVGMLSLIGSGLCRRCLSGLSRPVSILLCNRGDVVQTRGPAVGVSGLPSSIHPTPPCLSPDAAFAHLPELRARILVPEDFPAWTALRDTVIAALPNPDFYVREPDEQAF